MAQVPSSNRRDFLKASAAGAAAFAVAPTFIPSTAFGANERVLTGHIGLGGQGFGNLRGFVNQAAALCDVDERHLERAMRFATDAGRTCSAHRDFRELLDRTDLDAVVISTPDHWHAVPAILACQANLDVYCEKPLSLTVRDGREMVRAARDYSRVFQTGSQQRSDDKFRLACELVRSGRLGEIREVFVGIAASNHPYRDTEPVPDSDPPDHLDYDLWLGPAPWRPYNSQRVHYNFRFFWDYSGGQMTNWGAHHIDIAHWGLGMDESGPLEVSGEAEFHPQRWHDVPEKCRVVYRYPGRIQLTVGQEQADIRMGTRFVGERGSIYVDRGHLESDPAELISEPLGDSDVQLYRSADHKQNFLECIASRELPICDVEIGHRSATACHLGNIAMRLGRPVRWDPEAESIVDDDEAATMLDRPYRDPWKL